MYAHSRHLLPAARWRLLKSSVATATRLPPARSSIASFSSSSSTTNRPSPRALRRKREGYKSIPDRPVRQTQLGLSEAYKPQEDNMDDYLKKTSLSPWVPMPDAACRAMIDLVQMNTEDRHVDLGSGDGRVCFWAADDARVEWTLGVDVDEGILNVARDRLNRRHPRPEHIDFVQVDLLKELDHPVWDRIRQATVISMFFATPALKLFRPMLEDQLYGHSCKIVTTGYPMPGWNEWQTTAVLGTKLHYYRWGAAWENEEHEGGETGGIFLAEDHIVEPDVRRKHLEQNKWHGANIIDRTFGGDELKEAREIWLQGEVEDLEDDLFADYDDEDDDDDDDDNDDEQASDKKEVRVEQVKSSS